MVRERESEWTYRESVLIQRGANHIVLVDPHARTRRLGPPAKRLALLPSRLVLRPPDGEVAPHLVAPLHRLERAQARLAAAARRRLERAERGGLVVVVVVVVVVVEGRVGAGVRDFALHLADVAGGRLVDRRRLRLEREETCSRGASGGARDAKRHDEGGGTHGSTVGRAPRRSRRASAVQSTRPRARAPRSTTRPRPTRTRRLRAAPRAPCRPRARLTRSTDLAASCRGRCRPPRPPCGRPRSASPSQWTVPTAPGATHGAAERAAARAAALSRRREEQDAARWSRGAGRRAGRRVAQEEGRRATARRGAYYRAGACASWSCCSPSCGGDLAGERGEGEG